MNWRDLANPSAGGAEIVIDRLLEGFSERGHDVALVCGGPVSDRGYKIIRAGGTFSQYIVAPLVCMARFRRADIIIDVENGLPYFSPLWRRGPVLCLVHHVHTDQWEARFPGPLAALSRMIESRVMPAVYRNTVFVAVSQSTSSQLQAIGVDAANIHVIESGIDVPQRTRWVKSGQPLFVSLSRLVPHKRIELLLNAWELASREIPGRLVVAGDGPDLARIRDLASGVPRVDVVGRVTDDEKCRLLGESWALVSAAHHEGWGLTVMEAAAMGTPTLAIDALGIRDAVVDGVTGILVGAEGKDLAASLAHAWVKLASDAEGCQTLGDAARKRSQEFGWKGTIDSWLQLAVEVVESCSNGSRGLESLRLRNGRLRS